MDVNTYLAATAVQRYGALQKPAELVWLLERLAKLRPQVIVEIGCDAGGTLYLWNRIAPVVLGVDLPGGPYSTGRSLVTHGSTIIAGDSHDYRTLEATRGFLIGQPADMLFIDGDHTFEGVMLDFFMYAPLIREDGAIVLQDIRDHEREDVGVNRLWEVIKKTWPDRVEEILDDEDKWGGIGLLWNPKWEELIEVMDPEMNKLLRQGIFHVR